MQRLIHESRDIKNSFENWVNLSYDFVDFVLALTDNNILQGKEFFEIFRSKPTIKLMDYFEIEIKFMKTYIGINGNYTDHKGDINSKDYSPVRHPENLTLSKEEMQIRAKELFTQYAIDLQKIIDKYKKLTENKK